MVKEDKLLNTGGHFFVLTMVFRVDTGAFLPGEFSIAFSSDLYDMLPELASFSHPGLTIKLVNDLVEFWMHVKDTVGKAIMSAVAGWEDRARLLLQLLKIFEGGDLTVAYLDSSTMSVMDVAFRTQERKCMMKIELGSDYPNVVPKVTVFVMMITEERNRRNCYHQVISFLHPAVRSTHHSSNQSWTRWPKGDPTTTTQFLSRQT